MNNFVHDDEFVTVVLQSEHTSKQFIHPALGAMLYRSSQVQQFLRLYLVPKEFSSLANCFYRIFDFLLLLSLDIVSAS